MKARDLFDRKHVVLEYRPVLVDDAWEWYWVLLPLPSESHALATGSAASRGLASSLARREARRLGCSIKSVRVVKRKVEETEEALDPDNIDPKAYALSGPFGVLQNAKGCWFLTVNGVPREYFTDEKNASFYAREGNELHQTHKYPGHTLESPIDWYWRVKWGKTRSEWSPHYQRSRRSWSRR